MTKTVKEINASGIRKFFNLAQKIKDPIDLSIGQPDFDIPTCIKKVAIKSINSGFNKYTQTNGILELREKIVQKLKKKNFINVSTDQILVSSGTTGAIFLIYLTFLAEGDEVIVLDPYFIVYKQLAEFLGAKVKIVSTYPDFQPNPEKIELAITKKTKLIVLNSPNNPTGAVYKEKTIKKIVNIAKKNNILILSDEVYEDFIYEGKHFSPGSIYKQTITLNGFSKSNSMTGWRIGYVAGAKDIIEKIGKLQQFSFVCAPSFAQKAALKALDYNNQDYIKKYKTKRDIMYNGLKERYEIIKPEGAFYMYIKIKGDEEKFVRKLLKEKVIVIPGSIFSQKSGYIRISYANSDKILKKAVKVFQKI